MQKILAFRVNLANNSVKMKIGLNCLKDATETYFRDF